MSPNILALLVSLHLIPVTVVGPPTPIRYVSVAPNHDPVHKPVVIARASRNSLRTPLTLFDTAPHTHAGLVAWSKTLAWPWPTIIGCESLPDDSWREDSDSIARGPFQFLWSSWRLVGGTGDPAAASWREQYTRAKLLRKLQGIGAWACARITGIIN